MAKPTPEENRGQARAEEVHARNAERQANRPEDETPEVENEQTVTPEGGEPVA